MIYEHHHHLIDDADSSLGYNVRLDPRVRLGARNRLAREVREEARVRARERPGAPEPVDLARPAQVRRALGVAGRVRAREVLAFNGTVQHDRDVLEHGALDEDVAARIDLEGVPRGGIVVPVVVDGV